MKTMRKLIETPAFAALVLLAASVLSEGPLAQSPTAPKAPRPTPLNVVSSDGQLLRPVSQRDVGFDCVRLTPELRKHFGAPEDHGVLVTRITGGLGERLGLQVGDVLLTMGGRRLQDPQDAILRVALWRPSRELAVSLIRKKRVTQARIEAEPEAEAAGPLGFPRGTSDAETEVRRARLEAEIKRLESRLRILRERLQQLPPGGKEGSEGGR